MSPRTRDEIIAEARRMVAEIEAIFADAHYWNTRVRKDGEPIIEPDPDGSLERMHKALAAMVSAEVLRPQHGSRE